MCECGIYTRTHNSPTIDFSMYVKVLRHYRSFSCLLSCSLSTYRIFQAFILWTHFTFTAMSHRIQVFMKHNVCASKSKKTTTTTTVVSVQQNAMRKMVCLLDADVYGLFSFFGREKNYTRSAFLASHSAFVFRLFFLLISFDRSSFHRHFTRIQLITFVSFLSRFKFNSIQFIRAIGFSRQLSHLKWNAVLFLVFIISMEFFLSLASLHEMKWREVSWHSNVRHLFLASSSFFWAVIFTNLANCLFWSWGSHSICLLGCAAHLCAQKSMISC